ncbi:hypothetical protein O6H91_11G016900 [Diphasiastrum complanatum]|uniref:Uncharacterized protein n=1 Tax=Diphasiastrum complanatum TaxID=34168 RepID=A0ACC2C6Q5_DIPCM|nr:hypothetical protein O6H91_11G016900 [Diphasiastrum complanatum]
MQIHCLVETENFPRIRDRPTYDDDGDEGSIVSSSFQDGPLSDFGEGSVTPPPLARTPEPPRKWRDLFWLAVFIVHLLGLGFVLVVLGLNRFRKLDRLNLNRYTQPTKEYQTEEFWPIYAVAGGVGALLGGVSLALICSRPKQVIKVAVYSITTYLAVISVFCFRGHEIFWGITFAVGALLQFLYTLSVMDRLPFTILVMQKAVKMVWEIRAASRVSYIFSALLLLWITLWSFGVSGVVASGIGDGGRWWLLLIRGLRSRIGNNECLLCCVDFLFNLVETLVRFFNKYAYVEVAVYGKSFNCSARDAWELFQSTGIEALVAYDLSGAVLLMAVILGGLVTGSCVGIWTWFKRRDRFVMVGSTSMILGMILVGMSLVVVESAITSIYICYAVDPSLISKWDAEFADQIAETLHQRLQHRSGRDIPAHMVGVQLPNPAPEMV